MNLEFVYGAQKTEYSINENIQLFLQSEVLSGPTTSQILSDVNVIEKTDNKVFFGNDTFFGGFFLIDLDENLDTNAYEVYQEIFQKSTDYNLCRAWNFIPKINQDMNGEEIYRIYNKGRSKAFYENFSNPEALMPAAVGIDIWAEKLIIIFLGTKNDVYHFENPLQVAAFKYPKKYGVKAPSFARATKTSLDGKDIIFISGTASIRGHETVHEGNLAKQIDTTIENIETMFKESHSLALFNDPDKYTAEKLIFVRNKENLEMIKEQLTKKYPLYADGTYLLANVCRKDLDIEISITVYEK